MRIVLSALAAVVVAGATFGTAAAHERHHLRTYRAAPVVSAPYPEAYVDRYRNAYAWSNREDENYWASRLEGGAISAPAGH